MVYQVGLTRKKQEARERLSEKQHQPEPSLDLERAGDAETTHAAPATGGADGDQTVGDPALATGGAKTTNAPPATSVNDPDQTDGAPAPATGDAETTTPAPATGGVDAPSAAPSVLPNLFESGSRVFTIAAKNKDKLDSQEGEVVGAPLTHHYKVKLLTGPMKGEIVKFYHDKVTLKAPPPAPMQDEPTTSGATASDAAPTRRSEDFESLADLFST